MGLPVGASTAGAATLAGPDGLDLEALAAVLRLIMEAGDLRPLEREPEPLHMGYEEAARRLNIPEKWLRARIGVLPHRKMGKHVKFAEEDIKAISAMHFIDPDIEISLNASSAGRQRPLKPSVRSHTRSRA
ncbi:helix-turn-helix domain-containing protein [Streptomyces sp. NPDC127108]|uniref:helix-turn-helix domain-containing protein n=1 Tax=Streptomyces sp. NPDC127108 TaxID=3345361 RepID=UPI003625503A